jgi:hypothetical protein
MVLTADCVFGRKKLRIRTSCYLLQARHVVGDAFLANVYFRGDPHSPTTRQEWDENIRAVGEQIGIANPVT